MTSETSNVLSENNLKELYLMNILNAESEILSQKSDDARALEKHKQELLLFASLINHDFKEPVRTISAFSTLLERRIGAEDAKSQELLGFIQNGAVRMGAMIEALVEYIRTEQYMDKKTAVDVSELLLEAKAVFEKKYAAKKPNIQVTSPLPVLYAAPNACRTLFKHLFSNALEFQHGSDVPTIHISAMESEHGHTLYIDDNGIGVEPHQYAQIFQPFRRLNAIGTYKGCGLGLASCQKIMDCHEGTLSATASPLGGLRIAVFFPKKS